MSFFKRPFGKKGTASKFNRAEKLTGFTTVPSKPEPTPALTAPPPEKDTKQKEEQEQEAIDATDGPSKSEVPPVVKKAPTATGGQEDTGPQTMSSLKPDNVYEVNWEAEKAYTMTPVRHNRTNYYVASAIPLFKYLEAAEKRINWSAHIQKHEPSYFPYAVKIYYGILYYIQVLRARKIAGRASGFEVSLLNRFTKKYPEQSLPVSEFVFGYFNTIVSTELPDEKYDWIVPQIPESMLHADDDTARNTNAFTHHSGAEFLCPQIPYMMGLINAFIHTPDLSAHGGMMDSSKTFRPATATSVLDGAAGNARFFGKQFNKLTATDDDFKVVFSTCGTSTPFVFGNDNYNFAKSNALDSDFGTTSHQTRKEGAAAISAVNGLTDPDGNNIPDSLSFSDLDSFLGMPKASNLTWFDFFRNQAIIHARFSDSVYHLSDVSEVGGLETAIVSRLRRDTDVPTDIVYDDVYFGLNNHVAKWYPRTFNNLTAGFATNRAGVRRNEQLQAFAFATNCTLPIKETAGTAISEAMLPLGHNLRVGKFWDNKEWVSELYYRYTISGKPMFNNLNGQILRTFREKPHGTGIVDNMK